MDFSVGQIVGESDSGRAPVHFPGEVPSRGVDLEKREVKIGNWEWA